MRVEAGVLVGMLLAWTGCKGKPTSVPPPAEGLEYDEPGEETPAAGSVGKEDRLPGAGGGPKGCGASGTPWTGKHEGCIYEVGGCCYPDAASACAAAGCSGASCQILESSPAQITCKAG